MVERIVSQFWQNQGPLMADAAARARAQRPRGPQLRGLRRPDTNRGGASRAVQAMATNGSQSSTTPVGRVRTTNPRPSPQAPAQSQRRRGRVSTATPSSHQQAVSTAVRLKSIR